MLGRRGCRGCGLATKITQIVDFVVGQAKVGQREWCKVFGIVLYRRCRRCGAKIDLVKREGHVVGRWGVLDRRGSSGARSATAKQHRQKIIITAEGGGGSAGRLGNGNWAGGGGNRLTGELLAAFPGTHVPLIQGWFLCRGSRHGLEHRSGNRQLWVDCGGSFPVLLALGFALGKQQIPKNQVRLERVWLLGDDLAAKRDCLVFLAIAPQCLGQANAGIEPVWLVGNHLAEFSNCFGQHVALGIQAGQASAAQAQCGVFAAPGIGVDPQELAT